MNHQFILFRGRAINLLLLCLVLSAGARAQELNYLVGVDLGGNILGNDYTIHLYDYLVRPIGSVYGEYYFTNSLALHASLGAGMFAWDVDRFKIRTGFGYGQLGAMFRLSNDFDYPTPAVFARAGILSKKVLTNQGKFLVEEDLLIKFMYSLGVAIDYRITSRLALRLNFAANLTNIDDLDGTIAGQKYDGFTSATLGLSWLVFKSEPGPEPEWSNLTPALIDSIRSPEEEIAGTVTTHGDPRSMEVLGRPLGANLSQARADTGQLMQTDSSLEKPGSITTRNLTALPGKDSTTYQSADSNENGTTKSITRKNVMSGVASPVDSIANTSTDRYAESNTATSTDFESVTPEQLPAAELAQDTTPSLPERIEFRYIVDKGDVVDVELPDLEIKRENIPQDSTTLATTRNLSPKKALQISRYLVPVFGANAVAVGSILDEATRRTADWKKREVTIRSWKPLALSTPVAEIATPIVSEVPVPKSALDSLPRQASGDPTETNDAHPPRLDPNIPSSIASPGSRKSDDQPLSESDSAVPPIQYDAAPIFPVNLKTEEKATLAREKVEEAFQQALAIDSYLKDEKLTEKKIAIVVSEVYFEFDKTEITAEARLVLDNVVRQLQVYPEVMAELRGYADEVGDEEYNKLLSRRRAQAVTRYLFERGIQKRRLKSIGFGAIHEESQVSPFGQSWHRRVEITLVNHP